MQFQVTFKNMAYSEALSTLAKKKVSNLVRKYVNKPVAVHLIFNVEKGQHHVQCNLIAGDHISMQCQAQSDYMYTTLDQMITKLENQMRRKKEKLKDHRHDGLKAVVADEARTGADDAVAEEPVEAENVIQYEKARQRYYQRLSGTKRAPF